MLKKLLGTAAAMALFISQVEAANIPLVPGPWDPSNALGTINSWIINQLNPNVSGSGSGQGTFSPLGKNLLDNGDMAINQRNGTATCGTTSGPTVTGYSQDRWACDVNMASGAGQMAVITSSPTLPLGFQDEATLVRNSGSLGQPQCAEQELPNARAYSTQGQSVIFSVNVQALGSLAADNGGTFFAAIATGTDVPSGTVGGLGSLRGAVGMSPTTKASSFTISTSTGVITNATTVGVGQAVWMTAATMPAGIVAGQIYYVSSNLLNSGTSFTVAPTYAQAVAGTGTVIPTTGGTTDVINFPQITPAWTGLQLFGSNGAGQGFSGTAGLKSALGQIIATDTVTLPATGTWLRYSTSPIIIPAGTTEEAVLLCFTPNANNGSGSSTDGIAFTGAMLEIAQPGQTTASAYEFKTPALELEEAQRFYYQLNDQAAHTLIVGSGLATTTAACELFVQFPVTMDIVPTYNSLGTPGTGFFKILNNAQAEATFTTLGVPGTSATLASTQVAPVLASVITGTPLTAGQQCALVGQGVSTTNALTFTADF